MEGLRPLGVGELIDAAVRIYRSRAKTLMAAVAVPIVPVLIFTTLVSFSTQQDLTVDPSTGAAQFNGGDLALALTGMLVSALATLVASTVATAACFRSISGAYVGDDPDWKESLRFGFSRFWSVLGLTLLVTLGTILGVLACFVGVIVPLGFLAVAMPALLVEGLTVGGAWSRSVNLVKGTFWRVLGIVLLSTLLAGAFQAALSAPLAIIFFVDVNEVVQQVITALVTMVATIVVTPFTAALTMALYVDLRVRKEGFDLVLWAQRLGNAPTSGFPSQPGASMLPGMPAGAGWGPGGGWPQSGYGGAPGPPAWGPPGQPPPPPPPPPPSPGSHQGTPGQAGTDGTAGSPWGPTPDDARG